MSLRSHNPHLAAGPREARQGSRRPFLETLPVPLAPLLLLAMGTASAGTWDHGVSPLAAAGSESAA